MKIAFKVSDLAISSSQFAQQNLFTSYSNLVASSEGSVLRKLTILSTEYFKIADVTFHPADKIEVQLPI